MSVVIRLQPIGRKNQPQYRIVAASKKSRLVGEPLEVIGHYDPLHEKITLKQELYDNWIKNGAKPTQTVVKIYKQFIKQQKIKSEIINAITSNSNS